MDRMFVWVITNKASCDVPKEHTDQISFLLCILHLLSIFLVISGPCAELFNAAVCCVTPVGSVIPEFCWFKGDGPVEHLFDVMAFARGFCLKLPTHCLLSLLLSLPLTCGKQQSNLQYKLQNQLLSLRIEYA